MSECSTAHQLILLLCIGTKCSSCESPSLVGWYSITRQLTTDDNQSLPACVPLPPSCGKCMPLVHIMLQDKHSNSVFAFCDLHELPTGCFPSIFIVAVAICYHC